MEANIPKAPTVSMPFAKTNDFLDFVNIVNRAKNYDER